MMSKLDEQNAARRAAEHMTRNAFRGRESHRGHKQAKARVLPRADLKRMCGIAYPAGLRAGVRTAT